MTSYIVFQRIATAGEEAWMIAGRHDAHDAKSAIAAVVSDLTETEAADLNGQTFAACPTKGWRSETVTVKTETRVTVG